MRKSSLYVITLVVTIVMASTGVAQNEMAENHQRKSNPAIAKMNSQIIKLKKGELFLVISSITKPKAQNLMNDYFGKVFPIASKNGFKPLASLTIDRIVAGSYMPNNFVGLYSWPGMNAVQAFMTELPDSELRPMRMKIWEELKQSMGNVEEDFEFTLHNDKVYEVQTIWNHGQVKEDVTKFKGNVILNFPVAGYEDLEKGDAPSQIMLIEWDTEKDARKYRKKKMPYEKEETFLTHLQMPAN